MVSAELLGRYPFFSFLKPAQLRSIAKLAKEESYERGDILFREKDPATALFILLKGSLELFFTVDVEYHPELRKELKFRVIYPGEISGISALIEPYRLTSSARATEPSQVIKIEAGSLLELCQKDEELSYALIHQVARVAIDRLNATRLQLAAMWSPT